MQLTSNIQINFTQPLSPQLLCNQGNYLVVETTNLFYAVIYRCGLIYYRTPVVGSNEAYDTSLQATYHNLYNYDGSIRWLPLIDYLPIYLSPSFWPTGSSNGVSKWKQCLLCENEFSCCESRYIQRVLWQGVVKGRASLWGWDLLSDPCSEHTKPREGQIYANTLKKNCLVCHRHHEILLFALYFHVQ